MEDGTTITDALVREVLDAEVEGGRATKRPDMRSVVDRRGPCIGHGVSTSVADRPARPAVSRSQTDLGALTGSEVATRLAVDLGQLAVLARRKVG